MAAVTNFPEITNFRIARAEVFSKAFRQKIVGTYLLTATKTLNDEITSNMDRERREVWIKLKRLHSKVSPLRPGAYRNRGQRGPEGAMAPPVLMGVSVYRYVHNGPHAGASVLLTSLRYS